MTSQTIAGVGDSGMSDDKTTDAKKGAVQAGVGQLSANWPTLFPEDGSPLLHQLARTFWAFKQAYANEMGVNAIELGILALLDERDSLTQHELTGALRVDPSMITRTVKILESERGWLNRARDPRDGRLMRVALTAAGRQRAAGLPEHAAAIEDRLAAGLSDSERHDLRRILRILEAAARGERDTPPSPIHGEPAR